MSNNYKNHFTNNEEDDDDTEDELDYKYNNNSNKKQKTSHSSNKNNIEVIEIFDDTDDEELERAIQLSLLPDNRSDNTKTTTATTTTTTTTAITPTLATQSNTFNECCDIKFKSDLFYLNTIKGQPRFTTVDTISFEDLIRKKEMKSAMICGFVLEDNWIFKSIYSTQGKRVPITFVKHYDVKHEKKGTYRINETTIVIHPPLLPYQIFHAKLMLFVYNEFIRIVIPSSNPTEHDYLNLGQTIWHQDFYKKSQPNSNLITSENGNEFSNNLKYFLKSIGVGNVSFLDEYNFSTCKIKLITSIPGTYYLNKQENDYKKGGGNGIYMVQRNLNQYYKEQEKVTTKNSNDSNDKFVKDCYYQASSLGGDKTDFRMAFIRHLFGNTKISKKPLHIIFPTKAWVNSSNQRYTNSGCVFLSNKNYKNNNSYFSHFSSKYNYRKELIHHSKIMVGTTTNDNNKSMKYDWVYTGSHNFSLSAWGAFQKKETQISISNFEIGILITNSNPSLDDFTLPDWSKHIPFNLPSLFYKPDELPYIQEDNK